MARRLRLLVPLLLALGLAAPALAQPVVTGREAFEAHARRVLDEATSPTVRYEGITPAEIEADRHRARNHRQLLEEASRGAWFAALVEANGPERFRIDQRFSDPDALARFLVERDALVEVFTVRTTPAGPERGRRLTAPELAALQLDPAPPPLHLEVRFPDAGGAIVSRQLEFGLTAAAQTRDLGERYARDRRLLQAVFAVLGARDEQGALNPDAQAAAINQAAAAGHFVLRQAPAAAPAPPAASSREPGTPPPPPDLYVAAEVAVDPAQLRTEVVRFLRATDFRRRIVEGREVIRLRQDADLEVEVRAFALGTNALPVAISNPLPERDVVELRVVDPAEPDPRRWNRLEFGEAAVVRETALATFGLLNAHLDHERRRLAWRKSSLDVYAEPVFLALNLGGGFAGVGAPLGDAARLAYNVIVSPRYIPRLPKTGQMREMLRLLAARRSDTALFRKKPELLSKTDLRHLEDAAARLTEAEVRDCIETLDETDLQAMRRLARLQNTDAYYRLTADVATSLANVIGLPEHGFWKELFANSYVALNGDVSIKNIIAGIAGADDATSRHLVPLKDLAENGGSAAAWLAYFDVTFDLRALVNSLWDWTHRDLATRKLRRPFPHAPDLEDLAAYEVRAFGYPLLFFHKRTLLRRDLEAYESDYAYAVRGTRIVRRFATRGDLEAEVLAGRTVPLGYVRAPDGRGGLAESGLAVFAWRDPEAPKREAAIVLYGLQAFREQSELVRREADRFRQFERSLADGALIERILPDDAAAAVPAEDVAPRFHALTPDADAGFSRLLGDLQEWDRLRRLTAWGTALSDADRALEAALRERLTARDVALDAPRPLVQVDRHFSSFVFRRRLGAGEVLTQWTRLPALAELDRGMEKARQDEARELRRREALGPEGGGILYFNRPVDGRQSASVEIGPLVRMLAGRPEEAAAYEAAWSLLDQLPPSDRLALARSRYAGTPVHLDLDGDGNEEWLVVSAEFPPRPTAARTGLNPATGETEHRSFREGAVVRIATARRLTEIDRDEDGIETASRTFENAGTPTEPRAGALLAETRTIEAILRPPTDADPEAPRLVKLRVDHATGEIRRETYGLHDSPVEIIDDVRRARSRFDSQGRVVGQNTTSVADGTPLFSAERVPEGSVPAALAPLTRDGAIIFRLTEARTGQETLHAFDPRGAGRTLAQFTREPLDRTNAFEVLTSFSFDPAFAGGALPVASTRQAWRIGTTPDPSAAPLSRTTTRGFDLDTRELSADETDFTGATRRLRWDPRYRAPVEVTTPTRRTRTTFDPGGTRFTARTEDAASGAALFELQGAFDPERREWTVVRQDDGARVTERRTPGGWLLEETTAGGWSSRPQYDDAGREASRVTRFQSAPGAPPAITRIEDQYRWTAGRRNARARTWIEGRLHREFQVESDAEGRTVRETVEIRPTLSFETRLFHAGADPRPTRAEVWQNGLLRETHEALGTVADADGTRLDVTRIRPAWGLVVTNYQRAGDPAGRWVRRIDERGRVSQPRAWFAGTGVARVVEQSDAEGQPIGARELVATGVEWRGTLCDLEQEFLVGPENSRAAAGRRILRAGTPVVLAWETPRELTFADPALPWEAPSFALAREPGVGILARVGPGTRETNVVAVFAQEPAPGPEGLRTDRVDLRGWMALAWERVWRGPDGEPLRTEGGQLPLPHPDDVDGAALLTAAGSAVAQIRTEMQEGAGRTSIAITNGSWIPLVSHEAPRRTARNPWLPDASTVWSSTLRRWLEPNGNELFTEDHWQDAAHRLGVTVARKRDRSGRHAVRLAWRLGSPEPAEFTVVPPGGPAPTLDAGGVTDFSDTEFVVFHVHPAQAREVVRVTDRRGVEVAVARDARPGGVQFWPPLAGMVQWLPDRTTPRRGSEVVAMGGPEAVEGCRVISVAELAHAGLDVTRIASWSLAVEAALPVQRVTRLSRLTHGGEVLAAKAPPRRQWSVVDAVGRVRTEPAGDWLSENNFSVAGQLVARSRWHTTGARFEQFVILDPTAPGGPEPRYSIEPLGGTLVDHYRTTRGRTTRVLHITRGFEAPHLEEFDPGLLEDELGPSSLAFGRLLDPVLPAGRALGAHLLNRMRASAFARLPAPAASPVGRERDLLSAALTAPAQARALQEFPPVTQAWIARRPLPWDPAAAGAGAGAGAETPGPALAPDEGAIGLSLSQAQSTYTLSGLFPPAPGTPGEKYIPTVEAARLALLAIAIGRTNDAAEALAFYRDATDGGREPVLESYDGENGGSLLPRPGQPRPDDARATAEAQLAVAEAAFALGTQTGDGQWVTLGNELLHRLLEDFRATEGEAPAPRAIERRPHVEIRRHRGVTLWPQEAAVYPLGANARALLLLRRLLEDPLRPITGTNLTLYGQAVRDLKQWLLQTPVAEATSRGILPAEFIEIQDVNSGSADNSTRVAPGRTTSTEAWLDVIDAGPWLDWDAAEQRLWLDRLARAHATRVNGQEGLDWTFPLHRGPAVSPQLTARFLATAARAGHTQAEAWARRALAGLQTGIGFPALVAGPDAGPVLATGTGMFLEQSTNAPGTWPLSLLPWLELQRPWWDAPQRSVPDPVLIPAVPPDIWRFFWTAAGFYAVLTAVTLAWWGLRWLRGWHHAPRPDPARGLVPDAVLQASETRWAQRVLGSRPAPNAPDTRYSNAPIEANFLMQLRAIYKLVVEWRRRANGWSEDDPRLVDDGEDAWLNGIDEFAIMVGLYFRWVIKAGRKDGLPTDDPLATSEDSNHIWSRLVAYFSEFNWALVTLVEEHARATDDPGRLEAGSRIEALLKEMGVRRRWDPLDAREAFDCPARPGAFDLLLVQKPGTTLAAVAEAMEDSFRTPAELMRAWVTRYQNFRERELLYPVHPYVVEIARLLPHFVLMGLLGLVWYNAEIGGPAIYRYLGSLAEELALDPASLLWAVPLGLGCLASIVAFALERYRYEPRLRAASDGLVTDFSVTSIFGHAKSVLPKLKPGRRWDPRPWRLAGWALRFVGLAALGLMLWPREFPSFPIFMFLKGLLIPLLLLEAAVLVAPLVLGWAARILEDQVSRRPDAPPFLRALNQLNICPTRPASVLWLSVRYLLQPSVPTGRPWEMARLIGFYIVFSTAFFIAGGYLFKSALGVWFGETWRHKADLRLVLGSLVFWNTMYLLRFGVFVLLVGVAGLVRVRPRQVIAGLIAAAALIAGAATSGAFTDLGPAITWMIALAVMALAGWGTWKSRRPASPPVPTPDPGGADADRRLREILDRGERTFAVVYMSGDDLGFQKLTPELLMDRWRVLRDRLGSPGIGILGQLEPCPDETRLEAGFRQLYETEKRAGVTLWHPLQLCGPGENPARLPDRLRIDTEDTDARERLLASWHLRRWLVTMMSTAGHAQDTAINLVDIALRLAREGLGPHTAFYLISNKYEGSDTNRPSQLRYTDGEFGQRARLAELLKLLSPGTRAHVIHDWTPFGFKAGGMVGMDLVPEESLRLTHMLVLDRNANVHDLDALMLDIRDALLDPGTVIVVPGRGTTNTRTPIGQGSQSLEEGHRAMLLGLHALGGAAAECLGTGWGNLQVVGYGAVQRALVHPSTRRMPLTSRMRRGSTFAEQCEGLIGFGPHAVGISEDIWGVTQAAHNGIALGTRVRFGLSRAFWHKIRESWSHAEWLAAFPRWSGGFVQLLHDPLMQRLVDAGPLSIFAREVRMNGGRFYLGAPFALLNILILPIAVLGDFSPFVQILAWLWLMGLVMSQVLTLNSLVARIDAMGFRLPTAVLGALLTAFGSLGTPFLRTAAPALTALAFVTGGFAAPLARWLSERARDLLLFGPQLVIHVLGQITRQSLEFVVSGAAAHDAKNVNMAFRALAGPREDRPWEHYPSLVNLRSVVWFIGLPLFVFNVFALSRLDLLNVLLLLPVLLFGASVLAGPFLLAPRPGRPSRTRTWVARLAAWTIASAVYVAAGACIAAGGAGIFAGLLLAGGTLAAPLAFAGRYLGYHRRLDHLRRAFAADLTQAGLDPAAAGRIAREATRTASPDLGKLAATLGAAGLEAGPAQGALHRFEQQAVPWLKRPGTDQARRWTERSPAANEFARAFVLAALIQLWVFVVPVPESLVVTDGDHQLGFAVTRVVVSALALLAGLLLAGALARTLEHTEARGRQGLVERLQRAYRSFRERRTPGALPHERESALYALLTDAVTYLDQGSVGFARRSIEGVEARLEEARPAADDPPPGTGTGTGTGRSS